MNLKTKTVTVTVDDIRDGVAINCTQCPVALALQRAYPEADASASPLFLRFYGNREIVAFAITPDEVRKFISRVDSFKDVEPFSFEITPVPGSV